MQQEIKVGKGANKGKQIKNRNFVKEVIKVEEWKCGEAVVPIPEMMRNRFKSVATVQAGSGVLFLLHLDCHLRRPKSFVERVVVNAVRGTRPFSLAGFFR